MKYSVIIPAYQCSESIEITVKSVLNSGLNDFEIIIVNDGSTDNTAEICDALAIQYPQIICIHKENGGVSSARNCGIEKAQGEYILFMDSDDTYDTNALANAAKLVEKHNTDMLIFGLSFDYYKNDVIYRSDILVYPHEGISEPSQWSGDFSQMFEHNALSSACNKIFKTEIIKENKIHFNKDVFLMEDFLFVLDYLKYTQNIYFLKEAIYHYHQPDDEMRVYTRMNRIDNLNNYLIPFYNSIENLGTALKEKYWLTFPEGEKVLFALYVMLLSQKAYYADIDTLKNLSEMLKTSRWADYKTDDIFICDLKNGKYRKILNRHKKTQLRHSVAVKIKQTKLYSLLRGN